MTEVSTEPRYTVTAPTGQADSRYRHIPALAYDYDHFSRLTGPITEPPPDNVPYRVSYRGQLARDNRKVRIVLLMVLAPLMEAALLAWLLTPQHWAYRPDYPHKWLLVLDKVVLATIIIIELFRLLQIFSNVHGTFFARDPIPVRAQPGTRVAFVTTCVPGKEPLEMVRKTLSAALRVRHNGLLHVWLLDEGDDPEMKALCAELGAHHFSRKSMPEYNQRKGPFRAKTKHGNYNGWLDAHGDAYDFLACVDTDHVPHANYLERMLGYFRDPDVAFVLGPQVYGNYNALVTKAAESQQFLFHAVVQRAGNRFGSPMFVGTNNTVRISALKQIGGLFDSITEDMATGLEFHRSRNPYTGRKWRSVYTPDVLAVGEGPTSWTDFFSQQLRWSRGAYETLLKHFWKVMWRLPPARLLNYTLMLAFYPVSGIACILSGVSSVLYLVFGASGVSVDTSIWMMLYCDAALLHIGLYTVNRRHNVSPHERVGSTGVGGMAMGAMATPLYAGSLIGAALRLPAGFKVTPKGDSASPDRLSTFRIHLLWAAIFGGAFAASFWTGNTYLAMRIWAALALFCCVLPLILWRIEAVRSRRKTAM